MIPFPDDARVLFDDDIAPYVDERPGVPETEIIEARTGEPHEPLRLDRE